MSKIKTFELNWMDFLMDHPQHVRMGNPLQQTNKQKTSLKSSLLELATW